MYNQFMKSLTIISALFIALSRIEAAINSPNQDGYSKRIADGVSNSPQGRDAKITLPKFYLGMGAETEIKTNIITVASSFPPKPGSDNMKLEFILESPDMKSTKIPLQFICKQDLSDLSMTDNPKKIYLSDLQHAIPIKNDHDNYSLIIIDEFKNGLSKLEEMLDNFNESNSKLKKNPKGKGKGKIFNEMEEIKSSIDHLTNTKILPVNISYETYISLKEKLNKYAETYKKSDMYNYIDYCSLCNEIQMLIERLLFFCSKFDLDDGYDFFFRFIPFPNIENKILYNKLNIEFRNKKFPSRNEHISPYSISLCSFNKMKDDYSESTTINSNKKMQFTRTGEYEFAIKEIEIDSQ